MTDHLGVSLFINTPWGLAGNPASRPEIDAVALLERRAVPIEIKAYHVWPRHVPGWVHSTLSTGLHHVRFVLSQPTRRGGFVVGQQRCQVYGVDTLSHLLRRLPSPPVHLLWTPLRFTIPRDVIARRSRLTALGGFVPVDIDGDRLHRASHACELVLMNAVCEYCLRYARREQGRLFEKLTGSGLARNPRRIPGRGERASPGRSGSRWGGADDVRADPDQQRHQGQQQPGHQHTA